MNTKGNYGVSVKVWGGLACFTMPESKVERMSYPVMTPSAARGILQAIYWHPEMSYEVTRITVLNPIRYIGFMRNELKSKTSFVVARRNMETGDGYCNDEDRTQRFTTALKDVAYIINADITLNPHATRGEGIGKFLDQFSRRVAKGKCFRQPHFGLREFACFFGPADNAPAAEINMDLGMILGEMEYKGGDSALAEPVFMRAEIRDGVMEVPRELYKKLKRYWKKEDGSYVLAKAG